ncbi:MAG TPA: carbohydrate porin [Rhodospirillaceae bacterium]|nr:carbohydrate porin [Rhodospirillaceae bacterium]
MLNFIGRRSFYQRSVDVALSDCGDRPKRNALLLGAAFLLLLTASPALAEDPEPQQPVGLWDQDLLTGDWGGLRTELADKGMAFGLRSITEVFATASGGIRRGTVAENQFLLTTDLDSEKMGGPAGLTFHAGAISVEGRGPGFNNLGNALDVTNIELPGRNQRYTRLWTLWGQQTGFDGVLSVRAGQLSVDDEFLVSPTAANFINSSFGWPGLGFANLPAGRPNDQNLTLGPGYPLGAPGVRLAVTPSEDFAWLTAVFSHQPASVDRTGIQFKVSGDKLIVTELQYLKNQAKDAEGLPLMLKLGAWYDTADFSDLHLNNAGRSLQRFGGTPLQHSGEQALYGVFDQTVWRSEDASQALSLFLRAGTAPDQSVNLVTWYADGGLGIKGAYPGRDADILSVGFGFAAVSNAARAADRDARQPVRSQEAYIELNYSLVLAPWWLLQPDFQYVLHPGFGGANPLPTAIANSTIPDATVFGLRTVLNF